MTPPDFQPDQSNTPITQDVDRGGTNPQAPQQPDQTQPVQATSTATQPSQAQTAQPSQTPQTAMVSNPSPVDPNQNHPAVHAASVINSIGQALAGGPRAITRIDPTTGVVTRTPVRLTSQEIGMSLAAAALSGAFNGLAQSGPGASGKAAAGGFNNSFQQQQALKQQQEAQAQADAESQSKAYARAASIASTNAQTILSTAEAEGRGADTLQKIAATNKPLIDAYEDNNQVLAHNVTQDELLAGMQDGRYNSTAMLGPIEGVRLLGGGKVEATHAVIQDPSAKVPLTQEAWDDYADNHVQGYQRGKQIGSNLQVPGTVLARANEQKTMFQLSQLRHDEVADALRTSDDPKVQALASQIPSIGSLLDDPKRGAGLSNALTRAQSYFSHADINHGGRDLYESLQAMAQPSKPDPNNPKQFVPNKDAPFANTVAGAFSPDGSAQTGWQILKAYHDEVVPEQITNEAQAADMIASSDPGSRAAKYAQRWIQSNTAQKAAIAGGEERARQAAKPQDAADGISDPRLAAAVSATPVNGVNQTFLNGLKQTNPQRAALVQSVGEGRQQINPNRKESLALLGDVAAAYPDFDKSKVDQYNKAIKDYAPGGTSGKNLIAINTALGHLKNTYDNVGVLTSTPGISTIGSWLGVKGAGAYKADAAALSSEIATAYKGGVPDKDEINRWYNVLTAANPKTVKDGLAEAATLLTNRVNEAHSRWQDSVPSRFVSPVQFITPDAAASYKHVTGRDIPSELQRSGPANPSAPPPGATVTVRGSDGKMHWSDGKQDLGVVQ